MMDGIIYKAVGGHYFVMTGQGEYRCYLRGRFRKKILVGDYVSIAPQEGNTWVIEKVKPRRTELVRPPIANVNQAVIIFSFIEPGLNLFLLDRFLLQSEAAGIKPVIVFNKIDLARSSDLPLAYEQQVGYRVIETSAKTGQGIDELASVLEGQISVFAGPSGVGKSSLLNAIQPGLGLQIGDISAKLKRGRHTTRHIELIRLNNGGLVADTPGFSNLRLPPGLKSTTLACYFPDLEPHALNCRFSGCVHHKEPGCAVKKALADGRILPTRYENYIALLKEVVQQEGRY